MPPPMPPPPPRPRLRLRVQVGGITAGTCTVTRRAPPTTLATVWPAAVEARPESNYVAENCFTVDSVRRLNTKAMIGLTIDRLLYRP